LKYTNHYLFRKIKAKCGIVYTAKMVWLKKTDAYVKENCGFIKRVIFLYVYILSLNYFKLLFTCGSLLKGFINY